MLDTPLAMLAILATWAVWAAAFVAWGAAIFPRGAIGSDHANDSTTRGAPDGAARWLVWFWAGWCAVVVLLQVWHLFLPVDARAAGVVLGAAAVAAARRHRELAAAIADVGLVPRTILVAGAAIAVVWSSVAMGEIKVTGSGEVVGVIRITDTGLYHMQAARWNAAYPIVPGLGNLHGRLAYNNASLLYAALVDVGPWSHRGHHVANGLLALGVLLPLLASVPQAFRIPVRDVAAVADWARHVVRSLLIAPTVLYSYKHATSLSPDLAATLLGVVLAIALVDLCLGGATGTAASTGNVAFVALIAAVAVTVKLSMVATGGTTALVALILTRAGLRRWLLVAAIFFVALGPWCVRGVILSGYVAYPSQAIAFDVEWRVSPEWAEEDRRTIVAWARDPDRSADEVLGNYRWVGPWFLREIGDVFGVAVPVAILILVGVAHARYGRGAALSRDEEALRLWPAALPFAAALAFMFFTAPDISRFGGASVWALAIVAVTAQLVRLRQGLLAESFVRIARAAAVFAIALGVVAAVKAGRYVRFTGGLAPIPRAELRLVRTPFGLVLFVPTDSDRAWDAPLPSTPYPKPQLKALDEGDLGAGFVHREGGPPWEMQNEE